MSLDVSVSSIGMLHRLEQSKGQTDASCAEFCCFDDRMFPHGIRLPTETEQRTGLKRNIFFRTGSIVFQTKNSFSTEGKSQNTRLADQIPRTVEMESNMIAIVYRKTGEVSFRSIPVRRHYLGID